MPARSPADDRRISKRHHHAATSQWAKFRHEPVGGSGRPDPITALLVHVRKIVVGLAMDVRLVDRLTDADCFEKVALRLLQSAHLRVDATPPGPRPCLLLGPEPAR